MRILTAALVVSLMSSQLAWAQEEHRQLGPHVHGHGILNIAIENTRVAIELDVPGMDILGFEHEPATVEEKEAVKLGEAQLGKALELFRLPDAAGCKAVEAKVGIEADHDHEESAGSAAGAAEGHRDYNANYVLECARPDAIKQITFDYFKHFKGAHGLTVNIVSDKAQNSYEVTSEKPVLDLGGTM